MVMLKKLGLTGKPNWIIAGGNGFVILLLWTFSVWRFSLSPDFIPLHYTVYFGFDRFGPRADIFLFATLGTAILALNLAVAGAVFKSNPLWQSWWLAINLLLEIVLLFSLILVVLKRLG